MDKRCQKILEIFTNMEYPPKDDNPLAKKWLEGKQNLVSFIDGSFQSSESEFSTVLKSTKKALESWHKSQNKRILHYGIFDSYAELLFEVDASVRKIEKLDTRDFDIPLIQSCFEYYCTWLEKLQDEKEKACLVHLMVDVPCPPVVLAWLVAPCFSSGRAVIIHATKNFMPLAALFADLCCQASSSSLEGLINVCLLPERIFSNENDNIPWLRYYVTDFNINSQQDILLLEPTISLNSSLYSIMLVYESADLDSAAQTAIDWSLHNNGLAPWSIRRIYVQESVLKKFENKLIFRLSRKDIKGTGENAKQGLQEARSLGLKVIQEYLILGGEVRSDKGLLSLNSFRTVRESLSFCHELSGLASVSVWAEKGSVAQCVTSLLKVGTVWINSHGKYDPAYPISFINFVNNFGTFGNRNRQDSFLKTPETSGQFDMLTMDKLDSLIAKSFSSTVRWESFPWVKRAQILMDVLDNYKPISSIKSWFDLGQSSISNQSYVVHSFCPLGVIVFRLKTAVEIEKVFSIIMDALIVGNSLIICTSIPEIINLKVAAEKSGLPPGLITQVDDIYYPYLANDKKVSAVWSSCPAWMQDIRTRLALVTYSKTTWIPVGEIFAN